MQTIIGTDIKKAAELLGKGELVAIPTETVYGLAANALDENAVIKIYQAKNRPRFNPLILHIGSVEQIKDYAAEIPAACLKLAEKFSPGPITFLLRKKNIVPDLLTAGSKQVAIRIPDHPLTIALIKEIKFPLAAPSANPSGFVSPVSAGHVYHGLKGKIPYILDGGECKVGLESTIVGFEKGKAFIYRLGGISKEAIEQVLKTNVEIKLPHLMPDTPGQLKSHYATDTALYFGDVKELISRFADKRVAVITLDKQFSNISPAYQFQLSPSGDLNEAARNLFRILRNADELKADVILAEKMPETGLGRAINDRLNRAQHISNIDQS
jgi:L-threonylcarbamoyladenylate synthase